MLKTVRLGTGGGGGVTSVTATAPVASTGGTTPVISMPSANATANGYLTSTDWNTFNNKGSGTVTSVTGTAPVVSSGGTTPAISMAAANSTTNGYLTSTDWTTFNGKGSGSVTSVATGTGLTGGPITTTGTVSIAATGVTANTYGSAGVVPVVAINEQGQITSASNVTIVATQANFSNTAASATMATPSMMLVPEGYVTILINGVNKKIPYYGV